MDLPVYLDNHATTRVDPRVLEAMLPYFEKVYGNAASRTHEFGWRAQEALEGAREEIARALGASGDEIVFTSGATESNNLALIGAAEALRDRGNHIVTTAVEHHAVLDVSRALGRRGFSVTFLRPDGSGRVEAEDVAAAITEKTVLVSVMAAQNEVGTVFPIQAIGEAARSKGVLFHTDAAQAAGKIPIDLKALEIDLLSISGHKIYGPKGIGALYVRRRNPPVRVLPLFYGGGHERGLRPGTANVPGAVGLARALSIAAASNSEESARIGGLRDRLHGTIANHLDGIILNGHPAERLPGSLNLSFEGVPGDALIVSLRDVAVSSGSACTSATVEPSYVLRAMGVRPELALASLRFGVGRFNTEEEIDYAAARVIEAVKGLRDMAKAIAPQNRRSGAPGTLKL